MPPASPRRGGPLGPLECSIWNLQKLHLGSREEDSCNSWAATGGPPLPLPSLARAAACPPLPALHVHTCPCTLWGGVCCFPSPVAHQAHPSALSGAWSMRSEGEASQRAIGWGQPGTLGKTDPCFPGPTCAHGEVGVEPRREDSIRTTQLEQPPEEQAPCRQGPGRGDTPARGTEEGREACPISGVTTWHGAPEPARLGSSKQLLLFLEPQFFHPGNGYNAHPTSGAAAGIQWDKVQRA